MIEQVFRPRFGIVFLVFFQAGNLGGAGLAARFIASIGEHPGRCAFFRDAHHRLFDEIDIFLLQFYAVAFLGHGHGACAGARIFHHLDQMRLHHHAIVGQGSDCVRQLQWRKRVITLTDAKRNRFTGIPSLLRPICEGGALPLAGRQQAATFMLQIDAGLLTKSERLHEIMYGIDAQVIGQHVIVGVARLDDGLVHIDRAVTAGLVIHKGMVAQFEVTKILDRHLRRALAQFECGQRHEWLVG